MCIFKRSRLANELQYYSTLHYQYVHSLFQHFQPAKEATAQVEATAFLRRNECAVSMKYCTSPRSRCCKLRVRDEMRAYSRKKGLTKVHCTGCLFVVAFLSKGTTLSSSATKESMTSTQYLNERPDAVPYYVLNANSTHGALILLLL